MNCAELQITLADYLAGEAAPEAVAAVRQHLAECSTCHEQVAGLQAAAAILETSILPPNEAARAAAVVAPPLRSLLNAEAAAAAAFRHEPRVATADRLLRYAAVVLLSFTAGFLARPGFRGGSPVTPTPGEARPPRAATVAESFAQAVTAHPSTTMFSRSLLAIARQ